MEDIDKMFPVTEPTETSQSSLQIQEDLSVDKNIRLKIEAVSMRFYEGNQQECMHTSNPH